MIRCKIEHERAQRVMPGGVNSPVRAFRSVGGTPRVVARAAGCKLTDVDGREYTDFVCAWGAAILGHAHPAVVEAVARAARDGLSFGLSTISETRLAEGIISRVPSVERVRFVNSGTEAVMSAVRLARAATGRDMIIKFDGGYHGHCDTLLVKAGSGPATLSLPDSPGVTVGTTHDTLVAVYNDLVSVEVLLKHYEDRVAAILIEPVAGNMGVVPPIPAFLEGLRRLADTHGSLLIFDEVMTGFRTAIGGAQSIYRVTPDLTTFGKVIGGGLPVGAYGGRRQLMELIAPLGPVYQAGTFSGNPVTMAAGLATLSLLDDLAYRRLELLSSRLEHGLRRALSDTGTPAVLNRVGSMLTVFFGVAHISNMDDVRRADHAAFAYLFQRMLDSGVHLPPSGYESWFVSLSHTAAAIDHAVLAFHESLSSSSRLSGPAFHTSQST